MHATQRNATQRNATQRNETQRNATQRNATKRNETKRNATQRNATQRNETKRSLRLILSLFRPSRNADFFLRGFRFPPEAVQLLFSPLFSNIPNFRLVKHRPDIFRFSGALPEWNLVLLHCSFGVPP
jgi:hypothetical protein